MEEAIAQQAEARGPAAGTRSVGVGAASMDSLAGALALQNDLNEAVRTEDYALASQLRDKLAAIKVRAPGATPPRPATAEASRRRRAGRHGGARAGGMHASPRGAASPTACFQRFVVGTPWIVSVQALAAAAAPLLWLPFI